MTTRRLRNQQTFVSTRPTRRLISPIKQSHTRIVRGRPSSRKHGRRSTSTRVEGEEHASHEIAEAPEASNAL